jgi:hypothetical protein
MMASVAAAKDMTGKFGVGGNSTLGGVSGLNLVMQPSKMMLLDATVDFNFLQPGEPDDADAVTTWGAAAHAYLNFADFDNSNLFMGVGVNLSGNNNDGQEGVNLSVELPLRPTWYFNDHLAIFTQTGILIDIMQRRTEDTDSNFGFNISTDLLGSAGVNFFF